MMRSIKLLLAAVAILAALCSGAQAAEKNLSELSGEDLYKWKDGDTYIVDKDVKISDRIVVNGTVTLILNDGCTLSADEGINVSADNELTIKMPDGAAGTGRLLAIIDEDGQFRGSDYASIGGGTGGDGGTITINGGTVNAYQIGGGNGSNGGTGGDGGTITINGGTVNADQIGGGNGEIGGSGGNGGDGGTITINGGTVNARQIGGGSGTGTSGKGGDGGTITINGGTVYANGGTSGNAGIGGGSNGGDGGTITINGGTVEALSGPGAGIGGGSNGGKGGTVKITGGVVNAWSAQGKGIGGGDGAADHGTLSSGADGRAWIVASSVGATAQDFISGVLIVGDDGHVFSSPSIIGDVAVPSGKTLVIPAGSTLTIKQDAAMTVEQDATVENSGAFVNDGALFLPDSITTKEEIKAMKITGTGRIYWRGRLIRTDGERDYDEAIADGSKQFADEASAWTPDKGDWEIDLIMADDDVDVEAVSIDGKPLGDLDWSVWAAQVGELSAKAASVRTVVINASALGALASETAPTSHDLRITMTDGGYAEMEFWVGRYEKPEDPPARKSSSGACASGAAALVALAALTLRRRNR